MQLSTFRLVWYIAAFVATGLSTLACGSSDNGGSGTDTATQTEFLDSVTCAGQSGCRIGLLADFPLSWQDGVPPGETNDLIQLSLEAATFCEGCTANGLATLSPTASIDDFKEWYTTKDLPRYRHTVMEVKEERFLDRDGYVIRYQSQSGTIRETLEFLAVGVGSDPEFGNAYIVRLRGLPEKVEQYEDVLEQVAKSARLTDTR